jgi:pimeloyl-ACP methyl ester carboxylesterase
VRVSLSTQVVVMQDATLSVRLSPGADLSAPSGRPWAVMVHGLGGSSLNWLELMLDMKDDFDAVAVDLPGFGASPPPRDGDYHPRGHARAVTELIERLVSGDADSGAPGSGRPVHLFGNSLGGNVAVHIAAARPDLIASLTLIGPALPARRITRSTMHMPVIAIPGVGERLVTRYLQLPVDRRVDDTIRSVYGDPQKMSAQRRELTVEEARRRDDLTYTADATLSSLRGLLATYADPGPRRPWRLAERVTCPTLAIYGQRDQLVDAKAAHRVTRHFADAHVLVIPDSGHVAMMEHPTEVAQAWRRFIGKRSIA